MIAVIRITWRQHNKLFFTVLVATMGMVFISMSFYPEIVTSFGSLAVFFNSGALKQIFSLFNLDVNQLSDPIGFYETYCTMWVTLLGSLYFAYLGAQMIAKDIVSEEYKFVMMHPLSRYRIVRSRLFLCFGMWCVYAIIIGLLGYTSLVTYTKEQPMTFDAEKISEPLIHMMIEESKAITPLLLLSEDEFQQFTNGLLQKELRDQSYLAYSDQFDVQRILDVVGDRIETPEVLFNMILEEPENYYNAFGLKGITLQAFTEGIEEEKALYSELKAHFLGDDAIASLITYYPSYFFEKIQEKDIADEVDAILNGQLTHMKFYVPFIKQQFYKVHIKMVGVVGLNMLLAFMIALGINKKENAVLFSIGIVMMMYFLNSLFSLKPSFAMFNILSTFSYFSEAVTFRSVVKYLSLLAVFTIGFLMSLKRFNVQDL